MYVFSGVIRRCYALILQECYSRQHNICPGAGGRINLIAPFQRESVLDSLFVLTEKRRARVR